MYKSRHLSYYMSDLCIILRDLTEVRSHGLNNILPSDFENFMPTITSA